MANNDGIQIWTVPKTGTYTIRAAGAKGASVNNVAGSGMIVEITTTLTMGEKIKILVGQSGTMMSTLGGGGGGSFVVKYNNNTAILVAGGGGGSDNYDSVGPQKNGLVGNNGGNGGPTPGGGIISIPGTGGINGNGGTASSGGGDFGGAGGGGLNTDGGNSRYFYQTYATGGKAFVNGGAGGPYGGFGGGGGLKYNDFGNGGPGGGGYSGGGGGASYSGGGGGGSYSITGSFTASGTLNHDDGYVTITKVPPVVTTTVYDWMSLAVGQFRTFTTNDTLSLSIGDITTIDYSPTDWIKGTVTNVGINTITIKITQFASASYASNVLIQTLSPLSIFQRLTNTTQIVMDIVPKNVGYTTIPANSIITGVICYLLYIDTGAVVNPKFNVTINGTNIVRGNSMEVPIKKFDEYSSTVEGAATSLQFDGGCFVGSAQIPTNVTMNTPGMMAYCANRGNEFYQGYTNTYPSFFGGLYGYTLNYNTGYISQ